MHKKKSRIWEIDFLRGLCVMLMLVDHSMYLVGEIFFNWEATALDGIYQLSQQWAKLAPHEPIAIVVRILFFGISGISTNFSKNPLPSTLKLTLAAFLYNLGSFVAGQLFQMSYITVYFGILNCFAFVRLVYCACFYALRYAKQAWDNKFLQDEQPDLWKKLAPTTVLCVALLISSIIMIKTGLKWEQEVKHANGNWLLIPFMIPYKNFTYFDYFPVFPYGGYFCLGIVFGKIFYARKKSYLPINTDKLWGKIVSYPLLPARFVGKYALHTYFLHLPILLLLFMLVSAMLGIPTFA